MNLYIKSESLDVGPSLCGIYFVCLILPVQLVDMSTPCLEKKPNTVFSVSNFNKFKRIFTIFGT